MTEKKVTKTKPKADSAGFVELCFAEKEHNFIRDMLKLKKEDKTTIVKDGANNQFGSSQYMTTDAVMAWCNNVPPKYNFFVRFETDDVVKHSEDCCTPTGQTRIIMRINHIDGHEETSCLLIPEVRGNKANNTAQENGCFLTYYKRQLAASYFCLNDQKDDDANQATIGQIKDRIISAISKKFGSSMDEWEDGIKKYYYENIHANNNINDLLTLEAKINVQLLK